MLAQYPLAGQCPRAAKRDPPRDRAVASGTMIGLDDLPDEMVVAAGEARAGDAAGYFQLRDEHVAQLRAAVPDRSADAPSRRRAVGRARGQASPRHALPPDEKPRARQRRLSREVVTRGTDVATRDNGHVCPGAAGAEQHPATASARPICESCSAVSPNRAGSPDRFVEGCRLKCLPGSAPCAAHVQRLHVRRSRFREAAFRHRLRCECGECLAPATESRSKNPGAERVDELRLNLDDVFVPTAAGRLPAVVDEHGPSGQQ